MLPGKKYTPDDLLAILRRRCWLALVPFAVIAAATAVWARMLPNQYRSEALMQVVSQRIPESYVRSTVTMGIEERMPAITQQILSRTRLERIIMEFDVYTEERRTANMEDIIERMRRDVQVDIIRSDTFRVSFTNSDPQTAMRVTQQLASLFIEENHRERGVLAEGTNRFMEAHVEDARRRLIAHEKTLEQYRRRFAGQLPSQLESNLQVLQNTQAQIQAIVDSLNRDRDRRIIFERQLADLERSGLDVLYDPVSSIPPTGAAPDEAPAVQQLAAARVDLEALEARLTPEHPDVQQMRRQIRDLETKAEAETRDAAALLADTARPVTPVEIARRRRVAEIRAALDELNRQMGYTEKEEQRLREVAATYQRRAEAAPIRESEMVELTRDYTTLQALYTSLLQKNEDSKLAANLEQRQISEQFRILDPARVPERPFTPDRHRINLLGLIAGVAIGLGLIALVEYRNFGFRTDMEATGVLTLPVLAVVPVMRSADERRRTVMRQRVVDFGLGGTVAACLAVVAYTFIR